MLPRLCRLCTSFQLARRVLVLNSTHRQPECCLCRRGYGWCVRCSMPGQPRLHSRLHSWLLLMPPNALLPTASAGAGLVGCYAEHLPQSVSAWEAWEALHQGRICNTAGLGMVQDGGCACHVHDRPGRQRGLTLPTLMLVLACSDNDPWPSEVRRNFWCAPGMRWACVELQADGRLSHSAAAYGGQWLWVAHVCWHRAATCPAVCSGGQLGTCGGMNPAVPPHACRCAGPGSATFGGGRTHWTQPQVLQ